MPPKKDEKKEGNVILLISDSTLNSQNVFMDWRMILMIYLFGISYTFIMVTNLLSSY